MESKFVFDKIKKRHILFIIILIFITSCQQTTIITEDDPNSIIIPKETYVASPEISTSIIDCPEDTVGGIESELGIDLLKAGVKQVANQKTRTKIERLEELGATINWIEPDYLIKGKFEVQCCKKGLFESELKRTVTFTVLIIDSKTGEVVGETIAQRCCEPLYKGITAVERGEKPSFIERILGGYAEEIIAVENLYDTVTNETVQKIAIILEQLKESKIQEKITLGEGAVCLIDDQDITCTAEETAECQDMGGVLDDSCDCIINDPDEQIAEEYITHEIEDELPICDTTLKTSCEEEGGAFDQESCECNFPELY